MRQPFLILVCLMLWGTTSGFADETQRVRTTFFRFAPTIVNDVEQLTQVVEDLTDGTQFQPVPHSGAFALITAPPKLTVQDGRLILTASFSPLAAQSYQEDILLVALPLASRDTLRLRMTGTGYQINRHDLKDFGNVVVGDVDTMYVRARAGLADNERWKINSAELTPPFAMDPPDRPIQRQDTLLFRFVFTPVRIGSYIDTIHLVRYSGANIVETIEVVLQGRGVRFPMIDTVRFSPMLTGDTAAKMRPFPALGSKPDYEVLHRPGAPFQLITGPNGSPIPKPPDSVVVGVIFRPVVPGKFLDSVIIRRINAGQGDVLDTISITFVGEAVAMEKEETLAFAGVRVGDTTNQTLSVRLPAAPINVQFSYRLERIDLGPVQGSVATVSAQTIPLAFVCRPTVYVPTQMQRFVLLRQSPDGHTVDSTRVQVTTTMQPRLVQMAIAVDSVEGRIGDTLAVNISYHVLDAVDAPLVIEQLIARVNYNPTLWVPQTSPTITRIVKDDSVFVEITLSNVQVPVGKSNGILGSIRGLVTMGDAESCDLHLEIDTLVRSSQYELNTSITSGWLHVTNVWKYANGQGRFINPLQGLLTLDVDPNPVSTQSTLRVTNVPAQTGRLIIADALGQLKADLTSDLRAGTTSWSVSKDGGGISLGVGTYYARLDVFGVDGGKLLSVTRLFVVE